MSPGWNLAELADGKFDLQLQQPSVNGPSQGLFNEQCGHSSTYRQPGSSASGGFRRRLPPCGYARIAARRQAAIRDSLFCRP